MLYPDIMVSPIRSSLRFSSPQPSFNTGRWSTTLAKMHNGTVVKSKVRSEIYIVPHSMSIAWFCKSIEK